MNDLVRHSEYSTDLLFEAVGKRSFDLLRYSFSECNKTPKGLCKFSNIIVISYMILC